MTQYFNANCPLLPMLELQVPNALSKRYYIDFWIFIIMPSCTRRTRLQWEEVAAVVLDDISVTSALYTSNHQRPPESRGGSPKHPKPSSFTHQMPRRHQRSTEKPPQGQREVRVSDINEKCSKVWERKKRGASERSLREGSPRAIVPREEEMYYYSLLETLCHVTLT